MKKTYKNPTLKVVKTRGARLMQTSTMQVRGNYNSSTVTMGGRRAEFSDWDEEE